MTLTGIDIIVKPDDDKLFTDVPPGHCALGWGRCYVRQSDWPAILAALRKRTVTQENPWPSPSHPR